MKYIQVKMRKQLVNKQVTDISNKTRFSKDYNWCNVKQP